VIVQVKKLSRSEPVVSLEFPGKVAGLFEAEFEGDVFYGTIFLEPLCRINQPLPVEPMLRAAAEDFLRVALQLPGRDFEFPREPGGVVGGFPCCLEPAFDIKQIGVRHTTCFESGQVKCHCTPPVENLFSWSFSILIRS